MKLVLSLTLLLTSMSPAMALDCATSPDRTSGSGPTWRYRIVESKQCWYQRQISVPKADLRWAPSDSELPVIVLDEPLRPVLVQTVSYRAVEIQGRDEAPLVSTRLMIFWGWIVAAFAIMISAMVGIGRGRA